MLVSSIFSFSQCFPKLSSLKSGLRVKDYVAMPPFHRACVQRLSSPKTWYLKFKRNMMVVQGQHVEPEWHWPLTLGLPERMFQLAYLQEMENNCVKSFWNSSTIVEVMILTNSDTRVHKHTQTHTPNCHGNNFVSLTASGLDKKGYRDNSGLFYIRNQPKRRHIHIYQNFFENNLNLSLRM